MKRSRLRPTMILLSVLFACTNAAPRTPDITEPALVQPAKLGIPAIQGSAHSSPLLDKEVRGIEGVVTAVVKGRDPGFWMQDPKGDGDDSTSDGIFVAAGEASEVVVGDAVSVSGTVAETGREGSLTTTRIVSPEVKVVSKGNTLPDAVFVGRKGRPIPYSIAPNGMEKFDPGSAAIDFWESLEGMLIEIRDPAVVGSTSRYGDMVVVPDGGIGAKIRSVRGGVVLQEGVFNPQRIVLEPRLVKPAPKANVGDRFEGAVTGIVDYAFGNYRLLNTAELPALQHTSLPPEVTRLKGGEGHLTVATYNVLNLSAANPDGRFVDVARSIVENLASPDVIGLEEIQDDTGPEDDGVVSAKETFGKLIDAIEAAGGPTYDYRQIDPLDKQDGGQPGGNIRVGLLFNPERVTFVDRGHSGPEDAVAVEAGADSAVRLTLSPGRVDPTNPCFAGGGEGELAEPTRKSLAAELRFEDRTFFVIVNHWKSKRGDDALFGPNQPPARATEEQRTCQAEVIGEFAAKILARDANAAVIVLGDMNEHEFRPPIERLEETSGLTNLLERVVVADRYTYVYEGNSQVLDHILVSQQVLKDAEIDIVHANADRMESEAASDHDPIVARLRFR